MPRQNSLMKLQFIHQSLDSVVSKQIWGQNITNHTFRMTKHGAVSPKQKNWHGLSRKKLWCHLVPLGFSLKPHSSKPPYMAERYFTTFSSYDTLLEMVLHHVLTDCLRYRTVLFLDQLLSSICSRTVNSTEHNPWEHSFNASRSSAWGCTCVAAASLFCSQEGWGWWSSATKDTAPKHQQEL